VIRCYRNIILF